MKSYDKFLMFNLAMWDVGKLCSAKYDYILPVSVFKMLSIQFSIVYIFSSNSQVLTT